MFYLGGDRLLIHFGEDTVKMCNVRTGEIISQFRCDSKISNYLYALPDNKLVLVNHLRKLTQLWHVNTLEKKTQDPNLGVLQNFVSLSNGLIVAATVQHYCKTFDLVVLSLQGCYLTVVHQFKKAHDMQIDCIQQLPEGLCATGSNDKAIKIWNCVNFSLLRILAGHEDRIGDIKHVGGNRLVSCSYDETVRLWNYETGECVQLINCLLRQLSVIENKYIFGECVHFDGEKCF
jgi:WD40 repeat protein